MDDLMQAFSIFGLSFEKIFIRKLSHVVLFSIAIESKPSKVAV